MLPIVGWFAVILSCFMFLTVLFMVVFAKCKIGVLESYLADCKCVIDTKAIWGGGVIGRQMRMNMIFFILAFPDVMHKQGNTSRDAHKKVPTHLRQWVLFQYLWLIIVAVCMVVFCSVVP
ncbi:hypothetical protein ACIPL1_15005 [Pseudomonas sp. NPDC090202]|uniref:hypothetical protein n=1 Tax=unclassified Pseudomonas TaxID=196821 RepID=UPI00381E38E1